MRAQLGSATTIWLTCRLVITVLRLLGLHLVRALVLQLNLVMSCVPRQVRWLGPALVRVMSIVELVRGLLTVLRHTRVWRLALTRVQCRTCGLLEAGGRLWRLRRLLVIGRALSDVGGGDVSD